MLPPMPHLTAVIDFETTGLSPTQGDRATEVAIVLLEGERVVDRYQSLMNAGVRVPPFIESFTGITNAMLAKAPAADEVMAEAARFVGDAPLVAHNASFDQRFWQAELARIGQAPTQPFACTMLLSRRLYPELRSHKLGVLAAHHQLPSAGRAHRALADAEVAASLLQRIRHDLRTRHGLREVPHSLLLSVQQASKHALPTLLRRHAAGPFKGVALRRQAADTA